MLQATDITVRYGERTAVNGVSLNLAPGNLTAIIGPNGSGKSTLLQSLNGRLEPQAGTILLGRKPLSTFTRRDISRQIAVVAQEADLRFPVTVFEFVLGGRYASASIGAWGWETEEDLKIVHAVLVETELTELSNRLMNELSGGERQRAVLARALTTLAPILLLDEPTANLDLSHQAMLLQRVRARCDDHATAALVVTHDVNLAAQFADNVMLLNQGKVVSFGTPADVLTADSLQQVFEVQVLVDAHPATGAPRITPVLDRHRKP